MPLPRHSAVLPSVQLQQPAALAGITELRVHGVGGTPPEALLADLTPEQVAGDAVAGFYRTNDHKAAPDADQMTAPDADRHVECYSWGGLNSRSKTRVLWLALLPFLLGNLAGWMCSAATRRSRWRFALHRAAHGLGALALTVNAMLIAAYVSLDLLGYQAVRAHLAGHQWWLAPLSWHYVSGHPARQLAVATVPPTAFLVALLVVARRSWRYERVRPPYRGQARPAARSFTAAALPDGLADQEFWDGETSVRLFTLLHVAAAVALLAIALDSTARAVAGHSTALYWVVVAVAAAAQTLVVAYYCLDAAGRLGEASRRLLPPWLAGGAAAALTGAAVFAWLQPGGPAAGHRAGLPGMTGVAGWTATAIAVPVALALISTLAGLRGGLRGSMPGGALVTLLLGFSVLNVVLLGTRIWVAHIVGPVSNDATYAAARGQLYLPALLSNGIPLLGWAALAALVLFAVAEVIRWWRSRTLPAAALARYRQDAAAHVEAQPAQTRIWYEQATGDWERQAARARMVAGAPHDAAWLLWGVIAAQLIMGLCTWLLRLQTPAVIRYAGVTIASTFMPALMGALYAAWNDPARRRHIAMVWDVGTFWPRSYHPLAPPCYTERAVPELQRRMWWLHDNGGRVLLVGHSQGTVLAAAALAQSGCRPATDDHPCLVTFGSPLGKLYRWAFPGYVDDDLLTPLARGGAARVGDWRNIYYLTDPIAGPVLDVVDEELPSPAESWYLYGQNPPAPLGHSGYWADPRVWTAVNQLAASGVRLG